MKRARTQKTAICLLIVAVFAAACAAGWYAAHTGEKTTTAHAANAGYEIYPRDHTLGNRSAKVVLIEYAAPVCPHCAYFNQAFFPALKANYIDTGKVFYVFRIFPIRPGDGPAEKLADCLPANQFFAFMDLLFRNQSIWDADEYPGANIHDGLLHMARIAGMPQEQAERCMASSAEDSRVNRDAAAAEARYGIPSTPTFIINGVPQGEVPFDQVSQRLDQALAAE